MAVARSTAALEGGLEDGRHVDCQPNRLPDVDVLELRALHVHPDPREVEGRARLDREVVVLLEAADRVVGKLAEIDLAGLDCDTGSLVLVDRDEHHLVPRRAEEVVRGAAVVREPLCSHVLLGLPLDELVRPRPDRLRRELLAALLDRLLRDDPAAEHGKGRRHERRERLLEDDRALVRALDRHLLESSPVSLVRRLDGGRREARRALVGELHVLGRQLAVPAVELDALLELERELEAVLGRLERLGKLVDDLPGTGLVGDQPFEDPEDRRSRRPKPG